ncbi:MAG: T9SS type A sorting domain-containing protein [Ignavibacteriales bacterium]|nr:T9SS type A sorting domain-containing protein [Ignavibacteriales bacterium]
MLSSVFPRVPSAALVLLAGFFCVSLEVLSQSNSDSVAITFRYYGNPATNTYVPGQFNNWGSNSGGVISPGDPSQMIYDGTIGCWIKTYTFNIHAPGDVNRNLGDSVYQYKFNSGGCNTCWFSDPLNPETNPNDNNNSVLRLTGLFWFEFYGTESNNQITRITVGLVHANSDTIASITYSTGATQTSQLTTFDVKSSYNESKRTLDFNLPTAIAKGDYVRLVAHNQRGDSVVFTRGGIVVQTMPLPSYAKHGVTLASGSNDSTTFRLEVPGKTYVLLRVAPSGQNPQTVAPIIMRKSPSSNNWWTNVKLSAGTYEYLYEFENGAKVFDPWGRWNGTNGSRFTEGPSGLSADDYEWQTVGFQRPPPNRLIIYELNIAEFAGTSTTPGTFSDLIATLPYLDSLGINAIEVMPVNDYGGVGLSGFSWGYDLNSYFALEPAYGTPYDFKALVDAAHALGIAVIVDVVFNHLNDTSPLWQMSPDTAQNPYFKNPADRRPLEDGLVFFKDLDHWTNETQELVYNALKMWIDEYKVDGFRYDYTQGIGWTPQDTTKGILGWSRRIFHEYGGSVYQIAEHLPDNPALLFHGKLTGSWHDSFRDEIFRDLIPGQKPALTTIEDLVLDLNTYFGNDDPFQSTRYFTRVGPVNATVTHDELSLIFEMTNYQGVSLQDALERDKLYATFMFTSLGIPMLWEGMEIGQSRGWSSDGLKLTYRPVDWSLLQTSRGINHFRYYRPLIRQRLHNPALYDGVLVKSLYRNEATRSLAWGFIDTTTGSKVMVVANLSATQQTLSAVRWLGQETWYDVFDQSVLNVLADSVFDFSIPAYTAKVYANKSNEELGIITDVVEYVTESPKTFLLHQNYPNPFNPSTTISYDVPKAGNVSLKVYSLLGEEVASLAEGVQQAGTHSLRWDGRDKNGVALSSGVYFVRLSARDYVDVIKILYMK